MSDKEEKLMTVKEVAEYLRLDEHTVYRIARKGEIPPYKVAGQWLKNLSYCECYIVALQME